MQTQKLYLLQQELTSSLLQSPNQTSLAPDSLFSPAQQAYSLAGKDYQNPQTVAFALEFPTASVEEQMLRDVFTEEPPHASSTVLNPTQTLLAQLLLASSLPLSTPPDSKFLQILQVTLHFSVNCT